MSDEAGKVKVVAARAEGGPVENPSPELPPSARAATTHGHLRRVEQVWIEYPIYFITICTHDRGRILDRDEVAEILLDEWRAAAQRHGWVVGRYVIMPDHVHFFCRPEPGAKNLSRFMLAWKQWTSKAIKEIGSSRSVVAALGERGKPVDAHLKPALTEGYNDGHLWQREFFDHVMRSGESYAQKWHYVVMNPVRVGLVARPEDWKFHGEIANLEMP